MLNVPEPTAAATADTAALAQWCADQLRARNPVVRTFFAREAPRIARAARACAERFSAGGRILAFGRGPYATDAQHVAVEFVHPVLVGKRALPALDISLEPATWVAALARPCDIAIGFGPPAGDAAVAQSLATAASRGAYTIALPGVGCDFGIASPTHDEQLFQEVVEIVGHVLYESVHVFLEHRPGAHELGATSFLYPFLDVAAHDLDTLTTEITASIIEKARFTETLREDLANEASEALATTIMALAAAIAKGGTLLFFGNGGSATDATDFALDCATASPGFPPLRAISLALEPAVITAIVNDVGREVVFLRQIIAQAQPNDVAIALSTSGGSLGVIAALEEARRRGLMTVALLGYDGGEILRRRLADHVVVVRCDSIPRIQEAQAALYHTLRAGIGRHHAA